MSVDQYIAVVVIGGSIAWAILALVTFWLSERER